MISDDGNRKWISVRDRKTHHIIKTVDVTGKSEELIKKVCRGIMLSIDFRKCYINKYI